MAEIISPGRRYFVIECAGCGKHISLGEVPLREKALPKIFELQVTCPYCRLNGTYSPAQISKRCGTGELGHTLLD